MIKCWIDEGQLKDFEIDGSIPDLTAEMMALMDAVEYALADADDHLTGYVFKSFLKMCINTMMHDGDELSLETKEKIDDLIEKMAKKAQIQEGKRRNRILC